MINASISNLRTHVPGIMTINKKIIHIKNSRLVSDEDSYSINFKGSVYKLSLKSEHFDDQKGVVITEEAKGDIDVDFLLWLSVYFGEDFIDPIQEEDTRFSYNRGDFVLNCDNLAKFMITAEKKPPKSFPKWKKQLFEKALIYYSVAIRSGINMMPLSLGFFGLTLECIGNIRHGKRDKHYTLGNKKFLDLIKTRLKRYKTNSTYKEIARNYEKICK